MEKLNNLSHSGGNKSKNLNIMESIESQKFIVPEFVVFNQSEKNKDQIIQFINSFDKSTQFAVRSDSNHEDTKEKSGAGTFETVLNVNNNIDLIFDAIKKVTNDSVEKIGEKIPVIIQVMIDNPDYAGTIFGLDIRNNNPNYYTIDSVKGLGNGVVDGTKNSNSLIIRKRGDFSNNTIASKIIPGIQEVEKEYKTSLLDFEFAVKDGVLYLLQVRPLTAVSKLGDKHVTSVNRLISSTNRKIKDKVFGDMIDVNPAELLQGGSKRLLHGLFGELFPNGPLLEARESLGYGKVKTNMYYNMFDRPYIELSSNLSSFLPKSLNDKEKQILNEYYHQLLNDNPSKQDKLDTIEYPINNSSVKKILTRIELREIEKDEIQRKFKEFFMKLESELHNKYLEYFNTEKSLCEKYFPTSEGDISKINEDGMSGNLTEILNAAKDVTRHFTIYARGAFYHRDQEFSTYLEELYSHKLGVLNKEVMLPNGFNLLQHSKQIFNNDLKQNITSYNNERTLFETARENLKYIFMIILRNLGEKIIEMNTSDINITELLNSDFKFLIRCLESGKLKTLANHCKRRTKNNELMNYVNAPAVLNRNNNFDIFSLLSNGTYFSFGHKSIKSESIYIEEIKNYDKEELKLLIKDKTLLVPTATPEIDSYLSTIGDNCSGIVTKYGGPGAHIVLKIREYNEGKKRKIPLVVGVGDLFDKLTQKSNINIDFNVNSIS